MTGCTNSTSPKGHSLHHARAAAAMHTRPAPPTTHHAVICWLQVLLERRQDCQRQLSKVPPQGLASRLRPAACCCPTPAGAAAAARLAC